MYNKLSNKLLHYQDIQIIAVEAFRCREFLQDRRIPDALSITQQKEFLMAVCIIAVTTKTKLFFGAFDPFSSSQVSLHLNV